MNCHTIILVVLFLLISNTCLAQSDSIRFELYMVDSCAKLVVKEEHFVLEKNDVLYHPNKDGIVCLPELGSYVLSTIDFDNIKEYFVQDYKAITDTLVKSRIYLGIEPPVSHSGFIGFYCCGERCEGEQRDYYANGNIRIEGYFKAGIPQGEVRMYYPSGQLKQVDRYNKRGEIRKRIIYTEEGEVLTKEKF